jgi:hypothetical protein
MYINVYVCCWMIIVHCRIKLNKFWAKTGKLVPQTRRTTLLAKSTLIAKFFRNVPRSRGAISAALWFGQHVFGLLVHPGAVVHSVVFLSSFYNFITLKQHLGNAHNIKRFLK